MVIIILGGIGSLRGVVIGAFAVQYVNYTLLAWGGQILNPPLNALGDAVKVELLADFNLVNYNFLIFGIILAVMMVKRPEGLFPVEAHKAEMHGIGVAAEVTAGTADELATFEEAAETILAEQEPDPMSVADAALQTDTPPATVRDDDLSEDTR